jgi:hypothetical protein
MRKRYRIQRSDHQGIVNRAFGGRAHSWSPWRTVATFDTFEEAEPQYTYWAGKGLTRWRLMYGAEVKLKSL